MSAILFWPRRMVRREGSRESTPSARILRHKRQWWWISCLLADNGTPSYRRRINTEEKATAVRGTKLIQFLAALAILHKDDWKKRMNRKMEHLAEWMLRKKMDNLPCSSHHTKPPPTQNGCSSQTFLQILLLNGSCGIQVRPPKQQRRPLPSLPSLSVSCQTSCKDNSGYQVIVCNEEVWWLNHPGKNHPWPETVGLPLPPPSTTTSQPIAIR